MELRQDSDRIVTTRFFIHCRNANCLQFLRCYLVISYRLSFQLQLRMKERKFYLFRYIRTLIPCPPQPPTLNISILQLICYWSRPEQKRNVRFRALFAIARSLNKDGSVVANITRNGAIAFARTSRFKSSNSLRAPVSSTSIYVHSNFFLKIFIRMKDRMMPDPTDDMFHLHKASSRTFNAQLSEFSKHVAK